MVTLSAETYRELVFAARQWDALRSGPVNHGATVALVPQPDGSMRIEPGRAYSFGWWGLDAGLEPARGGTPPRPTTAAPTQAQAAFERLAAAGWSLVHLEPAPQGEPATTIEVFDDAEHGRAISFSCGNLLSLGVGKHKLYAGKPPAPHLIDLLERCHERMRIDFEKIEGEWGGLPSLKPEDDELIAEVGAAIKSLRG